MSKTQENLLRAFAGESMARNKYTLFANKAKEEGYESIARIFLETADNERAHAERELEFIKGEIKTDWEFKIDGPVGTTMENLRAAAAGEHYENSIMYPEFERVAREEGEDKIADIFKEIAEVEEKHEERYRALIKLIEEGKVFKRDQEVKWKCLNCGYVHTGKEAPEECPSCGKPQSYFEIWCPTY